MENRKLINTLSKELYTYIKRNGDYHKVLSSRGIQIDVHERYFERYYVDYDETLYQSLLKEGSEKTIETEEC